MSKRQRTTLDSAPADKKNRDMVGASDKQPASREAKLRAAAILEVLAGERTTVEAARVIAVSLPRYYLLETQALDGLVRACEPRNRGPRVSLQKEVQRLRKEVERLQRECGRLQTLARVAQRSIGLALPPPAKTPTKPPGRKRRSKKPTARALKAAASLKAELDDGGVVTLEPADSNAQGVTITRQ